MLRALLIVLCLSFAFACENRMTAAENELIRIATEKRACRDHPYYDTAIVCSLFIVTNDGDVLRLAEIRDGVPFVEREFMSDRPERYSTTAPGRDRSLVLLMAGPHDLEYGALWYRFVGAEPPAPEDEGIET